MSEARAKRLKAQRALEGFDRPAFAKLLQRVVHAVHGDGHCLLTALTAERALAALGIPAEWRGGYAIWRVGPEAHAMIGHHAQIDPVHGYHVWNRVGGELVDFTTWRLAHGATLLDGQDGRATTVEWCPEYLWGDAPAPSGQAVIDGREPGLFFYERRLEVEQRLRGDAGAFVQAEQLAALVAHCHRHARDSFDAGGEIEVAVETKHGVEAIRTSGFTLIRPA